MRLYLTSSVVNVDLRLLERSACGRSLVYGCLDVVVRRTPYTVLKFDLERVDSRWRGPAALEFQALLGKLELTNRSYYTMGAPECPGCGAAIVDGRRPNHAVCCSYPG